MTAPALLFHGDSRDSHRTFAVEILSLNYRPGETLETVADYLNAGTEVVWVIDPDRRQAHVHRADGSMATINDDEVLDGEGVLPGFTCLLSEVL